MWRREKRFSIFLASSLYFFGGEGREREVRGEERQFAILMSKSTVPVGYFKQVVALLTFDGRDSIHDA
jgi:hypothetical protein